MRIDPDAKNICFEDGKMPNEDLNAILAQVRNELGFNGVPRWRLLSARRKMGKTLFEIEESSGGRTRRLIGKIARKERNETLSRSLSALWSAGFRPPNRHTVTESIAYVPSLDVIIQEKAPGSQALDLMFGDEAREATTSSAEWLARLHGCKVPADAAKRPQFSLHATELTKALPEYAQRLEELDRAASAEFGSEAYEQVPSHGDFHSMNIFIAPSGRITGIDLDKFSLNEREADVGYFLSQTAGLGYRRNSSYRVTADVRSQFLQAYEQSAGLPLSRSRIGAYMAAAFLKNLHFELVLLSTGRVQFVEPFLRAAECALLEDDLELTAEPS